MAEWDRELTVDSQRLWRAAGSPRAWRPLGTGWDCDAWIADESVVWRVARRTVGAEALRREAETMPLLAPRLPAAVPVPVLVEVEGLPTLTRHRLVPGRELAEAGGSGRALGEALGRFLRALHHPDRVRESGARLRSDPMGRGDPARRLPLAHRRLDEISVRLDVTPLRRIVDRAAGPTLEAAVVCHGDLHLRHVLVDDSGTLAGVIDWGDCCLGSRAIDLAVVSALTPEARASFCDAYGSPGEAEWRHARMLGVMFAASLLAADPEGGSGRAARGWLDRLATDER
jgi:aminoglycoside phosphotransferase (APT) family kinase protein